MPLNLSDLKTHRLELLSQKQHIDKELEAVECLIEGLEQRGGGSKIVATWRASKTTTSKSNSLSEDARNAIKDYPENEFGTGSITNFIIDNGIRPPSERKNVRNSVYMVLRDLLKRGKIKRENRGDEKFPKYVYTKVNGDGGLFNE